MPTKETAETGETRLRREEGKRRARYTLVFLLLLLALCAILAVNINSGSVPVPLRDMAKILFEKKGDATELALVWKIRLPRVCMAAILGGALALSGFLLQTFFGNPIAGPFVLGISSGAKMAVAATMILFLERAGTASSAALILAAFFGSILSTIFVLLLARRIRSMSVLLVGGIMIGYICSALTDFLVTFADDANIVNLRGWSLGTFSGRDWGSVLTAAVIVGITFLLVFLLSKPIGAFQLGEAYAQSMGVNVGRFRVLLILLSSVLSACVTAFAGPISFVGIAVPHLVKKALGTAKPIVVIPATFLGGAVFCMFCDLIARTAFAPTELSISTVSSVFGAPVVIAMMLRRSGRN
jgi:iron complex transport system permease protein